MASSQLDIINLALGRIGVKARLAKLTDGSSASGAANAAWGPALERALVAYPWGFCRKRMQLSAAAGEAVRPGWAQVFGLDASVLLVRQLYSESAPPPDDTSSTLPFDYEAASVSPPGNNPRVLLCDVTPARIIYTARVTDPALFPGHFIDYLAWVLAEELLLPLAADPKWLPVVDTGLKRSIALCADVEKRGRRPKGVAGTLRATRGPTLESIANRALTNLCRAERMEPAVGGVYTGTTETSTAVLAAWADVVEACLGMGKWAFATARKELVLVGTLSELEERADWNFTYLVPQDCYEPRYLIDHEGQLRQSLMPPEHRYPFALEPASQPDVTDAGYRFVLATDLENAELVYTVWNLSLPDSGEAGTSYPPHFVDLLSWRLALALVGPLKMEQKTWVPYCQQGVARARASALAAEKKWAGRPDSPTQIKTSEELARSGRLGLTTGRG